MDEMLLTTLLILLGRATDVALGTLRIVSVVRGDKLQAFILGVL